MNDIELLAEINKAADAGQVRAVVYTVLPRGLHTFNVVSSKIEKNADGSRTMVLVGVIKDESPENGLSFRVQQTIVNKEGKKLASGLALAAGLFASAKAASLVPNSFGGGLEGCAGVCWLDVDFYNKGDKIYTNQVLHWGADEPAKVSKASTKSASTEDAPF